MHGLDHLDEDCRFLLEPFPDGPQQAVLRVPGSGAPISNVLTLSNSLVRWINKSSKTGFAQFLRALRSIQPPAEPPCFGRCLHLTQDG